MEEGFAPSSSSPVTPIRSRAHDDSSSSSSGRSSPDFRDSGANSPTELLQTIDVYIKEMLPNKDSSDSNEEEEEDSFVVQEQEDTPNDSSVVQEQEEQEDETSIQVLDSENGEEIQIESHEVSSPEVIYVVPADSSSATIDDAVQQAYLQNVSSEASVLIVDEFHKEKSFESLELEDADEEVTSVSLVQDDLLDRSAEVVIIYEKLRGFSDDLLETTITDESGVVEVSSQESVNNISEYTDDAEPADKPDYGLNEIPSLKNIKSRFEQGEEDSSHDGTNGVETVNVKRSESIASRLAKFKSLESPENGHSNGRHRDSSESSNSSSDDDEDRDPQVVRETRKKDKTHEIPVDVTQEEVVFSGMSDLKTQWESAGTSPTKEERAREIQDDLAKLRLRICHGKGSLKAKYESACEESVKAPARSAQSIDVNGEIHANSLKEKFERGELVNDDEFEKVEKFLKEKEEDLSVFKEQGTAADARHIFKEIDRSASSVQVSTSNNTNVKRSPSMRSREILCYAQTSSVDSEIVRSSDKLDDDIKAPVDLSAKFKFFENYQDNQGTIEKKRFTITPPRDEVKEDSPEPQSAHDPNIVRACDRDDDIIVVTDTAKKMLDKFRQLESQAESIPPSGPMKPLKRITPPREYTKEADDDHDGEGGDDDSLDGRREVSRNPDIVRCCDKVEDEFLIEARKSKSLKEKFERWDVDSSNNYVDSENRKNNVDDELLQQQQQPCPDTAKNLKAKFEAIREENIKSQERPKPKVNRFIDYGGNAGDLCNICAKKVYPMEKLEVSGLKLHKTCFRCSQCNTILRQMDNYTINGDCLYCSPHFKQLFKQCGNYDVGFGREQHKERWSRSRSSTPTSTNGHDLQIQYVNGLDNE